MLKQLIGTKLQVWREKAERTSGGLYRQDLIKNKRGKIVSKKKHNLGLKSFKLNKLQPKTSEELAKLRKLKKDYKEINNSFNQDPT